MFRHEVTTAIALLKEAARARHEAITGQARNRAAKVLDHIGKARLALPMAIVDADGGRLDARALRRHRDVAPRPGRPGADRRHRGGRRRRRRRPAPPGPERGVDEPAVGRRPAPEPQRPRRAAGDRTDAASTRNGSYRSSKITWPRRSPWQRAFGCRRRRKLKCSPALARRRWASRIAY